MNSILTVLTPADSQDLTLLATVKTELGIIDSVNDAKIGGYITTASGVCAQYCNRVFGQELLSELFRLGRPGSNRASRQEDLVLKRFPLAAINSITEDDTVTLVAGDDYEFDPTTAIVRRLSGGLAVCWPTAKIVIAYVAGYALLDSLPPPIERACIELVKHYWFRASRDPSVRQISIPGVVERQYFVGAAGDPGIPSAVTDLLDPFRDLRSLL